jgi:hypothetical protein
MPKPQTIIALLLALLLALAGFAQPPVPATLPEPRVIVAVLDRSPSFRYSSEARDKIKAIVRALGPGDTFLLLTLGGEFSPAKDALIQCIMPEIDASLLLPAHTVRQWRDRQTRIAAVWSASSQKQGAVLSALDHPLAPADGTPLYQLLGYVAHWFGSAPPHARRILVIFSDLEHDYSGLRSNLPPKGKLPFADIAVTAAFVPWGPAWDTRERAWREWFASARFAMLDDASARNAVLLQPNATPRQALKAF